MARNGSLIIPRPITDKMEHDFASHHHCATDLYEVAVQIARERSEILRQLKEAILRGDTSEVYKIAASLCGLGDEYEEGDRTDSRQQ